MRTRGQRTIPHRRGVVEEWWNRLIVRSGPRQGPSSGHRALIRLAVPQNENVVKKQVSQFLFSYIFFVFDLYLPLCVWSGFAHVFWHWQVIGEGGCGRRGNGESQDSCCCDFGLVFFPLCSPVPHFPTPLLPIPFTSSGCMEGNPDNSSPEASSQQHPTGSSQTPVPQRLLPNTFSCVWAWSRGCLYNLHIMKTTVKNTVKNTVKFPWHFWKSVREISVDFFTAGNTMLCD